MQIILKKMSFSSIFPLSIYKVLFAYYCLSLPISAYLCLSLPISAYLCLSLPILLSRLFVCCAAWEAAPLFIASGSYPDTALPSSMSIVRHIMPLSLRL